MYTANSCIPLESTFYRPIDAAIRWCGLMDHEARILEIAWETPYLLDKKFPQWPCLHINTEKIIDAVRSFEIPYGNFGITVQPGTPIDHRFLTVRHSDLKSWMIHNYPEQRPAFLFGENITELENISIETYLTLQAHRDALEIQLEAKETAHQTLLEELKAIGLERERLHLLYEARGELSDRSEASYKCIIGALLETLLGSSPAGKPNSVFKTQASIVDSITSHYEGVPGLSKRSLDEKFAAGRRSLLGG
ncbi:hypothetical protein AB1462_14255 [Pseudomonas sp. SB113]|uniref:hypothetical protein n=1 Tax=Pseudomonas sp. SB113 TaxID=3154123 RepID=UPI00345CAFA0